MNYITHPVTGKSLNIYSEDAKSLLKHYIKSFNTNTQNIQNVQMGGGQNNKSAPEKYGTFYFFSMKGCGHCTEFKPIWKQLIGILPDKPIPNKKLNQQLQVYFEHDGSNGVSDKAKKYKDLIDGFPTFIFVNKNERPRKYEEERTKTDIINFIKKYNK